MRPLVASLVLTLAAAGCVAPLPGATESAAGAPDAAAVVASLQAALAGVPCEASVGAETSDNLRVLATLGFENGGRAELDPWDGWLVTSSKAGVEIIDARDPLAPKLAATFVEEDTWFGDTKWLADGSAIAVARGARTIEVLGVDWSGAEPVMTSLGIWEYPMPGPGHLSTNMHMLEAHTIAGEPYFLVAPNDDTGVWMVRVKLEGAAASFDTLRPIGAPLTGGPLGPHDMTIEHDALLDKPILYIANGFEGWQAWDVSAPDAPKLLALVPNLDPGQGYLHTIAGNKVGERRIVATISEVGVNTMKLFDATDFARPILLGEWWSDKAAPYMPQHDINMLDGRLYMAHYRDGVFVFDLTKLGSAPLLDTLSLAPVAHFAPQAPQDDNFVTTLGFSNIFDVVVMNGVLYVSDFTDGPTAVTAVGYGCLAAGDVKLTAG